MPKKLLAKSTGFGVIQLYAGECTPSIDWASKAPLAVSTYQINVQIEANIALN